MNDKVNKRHLIQVDLSGCKNMKECMKVKLIGITLTFTLNQKIK